MILTALYKDGSNDTFKVENDCQIWKRSKETFGKHPDARILVKDERGTLLRDVTLVETKRGLTMVNAVKKPRAGDVAEASLAAVNGNAEKNERREKRGGCIFITA